jgi:hypothetical protein
MPKPELPHDLHPEELNAMICALGREKGLPLGIHPDLVGPDEDNHAYWGVGQEERHKQSRIWRHKLIAELARRPEWIAEWRAERDLNRRVRELCEHKNLMFWPWECHPADAPDEMPERDSDQMHMYANTVPQAVRLRRQLIKELEASDR